MGSLTTTSFRPLVRVGGLGERVRDWAHEAEVRLIGSRLIEREVPELGLTYVLPTHTLLGRLIRVNGMYEEHMINWVTERYEALRGGVMIDVGANIGWYAALFARMADDHRNVFAFEPDPANFEILSKTLERNGSKDVNLIRAAVGARHGEGMLNLGYHRNPGSHSMLSGQYSEGTVEVPIVTLDEIVLPALAPGQQVSLIKMDIEGYELLALQGAEQLLARTRYVILEFSAHRMHKGGLDPADLVDLIERQGFQMHEFNFEGEPRPIGRDRLLDPGFRKCNMLLDRIAPLPLLN